MTNIISFNPKEPEQSDFIKIHYTDNTIEIMEAESFGHTSDIPGFMAIFGNDGEIISLVSTSAIKKIELLPGGISGE